MSFEESISIFEFVINFRIYEVKFDSWRILVDLSQIIVAYMDTNPQLIKTYCLETAERQVGVGNNDLLAILRVFQ